jgi:hypothetical protein
VVVVAEGDAASLQLGQELPASIYVGRRPVARAIHLRDDIAVDAVEILVGHAASAPFGDAMAERVHSIAGRVAVVVVGREQIAEAVIEVLIVGSAGRARPGVEQVAGGVITVSSNLIGRVDAQA